MRPKNPLADFDDCRLNAADLTPSDTLRSTPFSACEIGTYLVTIEPDGELWLKGQHPCTDAVRVRHVSYSDGTLGGFPPRHVH